MAEQQIHRFTATIGADEIIVETGKLAEQAGGAVTVRLADSMVFATATMSKNARSGIDFFPLSVDYEEKLYAAGRIPGSFFRREGKPSEQSILNARVIDRPLRPLFPDQMRNEVQIILSAFSHDQEHQVDMIGVLAASAALTISNIPWNGPVAAIRIGLIDGELVVNPSISQMANSTLDLRVAGTEFAINMVECAANEIDEETMLRALRLAHDSMQPLIQLQHQMRAAAGKPKSAYIAAKVDQVLNDRVRAQARAGVREVIANTTDRGGRNEALDALRELLIAEYKERTVPLDEDDSVGDYATFDESKFGDAFDSVITEEVRRRITEDGVRPDGRGYTDIRSLSAEVGIVPRVHGTGLFKRGQTQVLTFATLGTPRDSQELDTLSPEENKRYMHHYNFPPYSTGETTPLRGPKRREIGHGALAEAALRAMIPDEDVFPYTIRLVSEVLSSNGSTSMASVCGSTLALMDAGVPIKRPVAGIAMGLVKEGDRIAVLTDIQGLEDHLGDMDFKVAGTSEGITALQMDIKIDGVTDEVMARALAQAKDARMIILEVIRGAIAEPRNVLSPYAPRMTTIKVPVDKIGMIIGPGGKTVRGIQERTGVKIDIQDDGTIFVAGVDGRTVDQAINEIRGMTEEPEVGRVYTGKVTRIEPYGAFVEYMAGREGLVHISQLADRRIETVEEEVALGDEIMVMVTDAPSDGKVRLSRQAVLAGWTAEEARARDRRPPGGGGGDRGGRPGGGGDRGGRPGGGGGGDRGGRR
ncbi:MAG: polyribonucleotide nucleotidyltransferase [Chloroflexota bacterium]|nr:polyribonucleotide nucleotidyltransferase [Chloroflexota bacterium]